ncbi:MAG: extracellular solute-binding protein [Trueperaceae bacterium]|nr:extracellular solute-binding protein [Trueperaceae bacterium]
MHIPRSIRRHALALALIGVLAAGHSLAQNMVLEMPSWQATEPGTSDWWRALIAEFESQNPGVTIEFTHEPFASYNQTMVTRFAGGNPPDILHLPAANFMVYAQEGWLAPLDDRLAETPDVVDSWTPVQSTCEYEGETLCMVVLGYGYVLGWNEAAFEEAGLTGPPTTSEELIEFSRALTVERDGAVERYGFVFPTVAHPGVESTATAFIFEYDPDGHWVDEAGELNRDAIRFAWTQMRRLVEDGSVPLGLDNNAKRQFFVEGRAAMMLEGPWIQGNINAAGPGVQEHLRVAATPFTGTVYGGASNVLAVPADISPERQELAWEFIRLFTSPEWQAAYATVAGQPPARAGVLDDTFLAENVNMQTYVAEANAARDYIPPGLAENYTRFRDLVVEATLAAVVQGQDMDAVMNQLANDISRLR